MPKHTIMQCFWYSLQIHTCAI